MFTVKIDTTNSLTSSKKYFSSIERAYRCYNANKGEGVNVLLLDASNTLIEGSKTY